MKLISRRCAGSPTTIILFVTSLLLLAWTFEMIHRSVQQQSDYRRLRAQLEAREANAHARALESLVVSSDCKAIQPVTAGETEAGDIFRPYRALSLEPVRGQIEEEVDFARVLLTYGKTALKVLSRRTAARRLGISGDALVPRIVHFLWPPGKEFTFLNYLSMRSAERFVEPQYMVVHGGAVPSGPWWQQALDDLPNIVFMKKVLDSHLGHVKVHDKVPAQNIARMQIMLDYGGVVLEPDVLLLRPLDPLLHDPRPLVVGREASETLTLAAMVGMRGSPFLRVLLEAYHSALLQGRDAAHLRLLPHLLAAIFPNLVAVEERRLGVAADNLPVLLSIHVDWHQHFALRLHEDAGHRLPQHPDHIKLLDSTVGEVMRYVYFGDKQTHGS